MMEAGSLPGPGGLVQALPFEDERFEGGFWKRMSETLKLLLFHPSEFGERLTATDDTVSAWWFLALASGPGFVVALIVPWFRSAQGLNFRVQGALGEFSTPWIFIALVGGLVSIPVSAALSMWVMGGISHLSLKLFGGLKPGSGFLQTRRAAAYSQALLQLTTVFQAVPYPGARWLPILGTSLFFTWLALLSVLVAAVHRTGRARSFLAVAAPWVLFLLLFFRREVVSILTRAWSALS